MVTASALHPLHRLWRALPARSRRRLLSHGSALLAPRPDRPPPPVDPACGMVVGGEIGRASGLGEAARLMLRGLEALGLPAHALQAGLRVPGDAAEAPAGPGGQGERPPPGLPLLLHVNAPLLPAALLRLPRGLLRGRRVVGHWAWELPVAPPDWRAGTGFVHEVWAPSRFTAQALEALMPGRVRVVPYPIAAAPPRPSALGRADFGLPGAAVVTLVSFSLASSFARKNPLAAIAAHRAAFGDRADRVLVVKTGSPDRHAGDMALLHAAAEGAANIRFETRVLPMADSHALTACADIVLSLHRSEGFGLVPAEAMLLGRCVVATDWSATAEFLDAGCGVPVPFRLVPARDPRGVFEAEGAVWADADVGAAARALHDLAGDPGRRAALGEAARRAAQERLGAGPLRDALMSLA
ncbi:MAG: glycosyltransferase [Janthinobacterium lividum]